MKYGYIRVSSRDQNESRQVVALEKEGLDRIFVDKQSGKDFNRPQYHELMSVVREGDVICVASIDRLGRNYHEIQEEWRRLVNDKKVDIYVLDMSLLDTRICKDLMGTFVSDLILQILSFVAENERNNIRRRQAEGIEAAKNRGVKFGRPPVPLPDIFFDQVSLWQKGSISSREAAEKCGMARSTFIKKANELWDTGNLDLDCSELELQEI